MVGKKAEKSDSKERKPAAKKAGSDATSGISIAAGAFNKGDPDVKKAKG